MNAFRPIAAALFAVTVLAGCAGSLSQPIPQGTASPAASAAVSTKPAAEAPAASVSTCDAVREAFLTGTPAQIAKALHALQIDKTADATAREYAQYWLIRDAKEKDMRSMDQDLITSACSG